MPAKTPDTLYIQQYKCISDCEPLGSFINFRFQSWNTVVPTDIFVFLSSFLPVQNVHFKPGFLELCMAGLSICLNFVFDWSMEEMIIGLMF